MNDAALFVGRELELETLRARLLRARDGFGAVIALVGEAGIGKTTTAKAFAAYARGEGAQVATGAATEGESSAPFGPWPGALGEVVTAVGARKAQRAIGASRGAFACFVPALRARTVMYPLGAREERSRLHHGIVQLLSRASTDAPLVLVLDDLQWADTDSLGVLDHVARRAARAPWVIVLAYREESEAGARTPLGDAIAALRRDGPFERIALRGFAPNEVSEYLARRAGKALPESVARFVFDDTVGNPLYVREVFEHLVEEGAFAKGAIDEATLRARGARGVREVIARRLARLRESTVRVLQVVGATGEPIEEKLLGEVSGLSEPALLDCVGEASASGLLRTTGDGRYEPSHAIVRRAIHDATNPDRRARVARRMAEALEAQEGCAATIAACYRVSAALGGEELGVIHAIEAAREANAACAHERAVAFLRIARELARNAPAHVKAEALCELAIAEARALHADDAIATLDEALAALEHLEAPKADVAAYVAEVARELRETGVPSARWEPIVERGLALGNGARDLTWARLVLLVDRVESLASGAVHVVRVLPREARAVALARTRGDEDDHASTIDHEPRTRAETSQLLRLARKWTRPTASLRAFDEATRDLVYRHGAFADARRVAGEMLALGERCGSIGAQAEALAQLACCEAAMGDLDRARETRSRALALTAELGGAASRVHAVSALATEATLGYFAGCDWRSVATAAARFSADPSSRRSAIAHVAAGVAALGYALAGYARESRSLLQHMAPVFARCDVRVYGYGVGLDCAATAAWHLGARDLAQTYRELARAADPASGAAPLANRDLVLARLAILAESWDEAFERLAGAHHSLGRAGLRPLQAVALHDEAAALLRAGRDAGRARERLAEALVTFRTLGMDPWIAHAHQLLGLERPAYPDGLTSREVEIVRLVAEGRSNKEIAAKLDLSAATAQRQVVDVLAKIGAAGRADARAYALKHRIADASA